jgi:hypothetical protein
MGKMAHIKPILCIFAKLFYSSGYTAPEMHHQQANVIQTTRARLACVADLVRASSCQDEHQKYLLVPGTIAGFKAAFPCTTHTPVPFRLPAQHTKQGKHAKAKQKYCKESTRIAPFFVFFTPCTRWLAKLRFRCAAGRLDGTWYPRRGLKRAKNGLLSADRS